MIPLGSVYKAVSNKVVSITLAGLNKIIIRELAVRSRKCNVLKLANSANAAFTSGNRLTYYRFAYHLQRFLFCGK